jgi:inorganic pyrophosphatase
MVMTDEPSEVGALLNIRLIGVAEAQEVENDRKERSDRLFAVAAVTHLHADVRSAADLPATFIDHLTQFWINKDRLECKAFTVLGVKGPEVAIDSSRRRQRPRKGRVK